MKFFHFRMDDVSEGLAVEMDGTARGLMTADTAYPGTLDALVRRGPSALFAAGKTFGFRTNHRSRHRKKAAAAARAGKDYLCWP